LGFEIVVVPDFCARRPMPQAAPPNRVVERSWSQDVSDSQPTYPARTRISYSSVCSPAPPPNGGCQNTEDMKRRTSIFGYAKCSLAKLDHPTFGGASWNRIDARF